MKSLKIKIGMTKSFLKMYEKYVDKGIMRNTLDLEKDVKEAVLKFDYLLKRDKFSKKEIIFNDELKFHNQYINRLRNRLKIIFGDFEK